jgi:hypothetical protein
MNPSIARRMNMKLPTQVAAIPRGIDGSGFDAGGVQANFLGNIWNKIKCKACRAACALIPIPVGRAACNLACDRTVCR